MSNTLAVSETRLRAKLLQRELLALVRAQDLLVKGPKEPRSERTNHGVQASAHPRERSKWLKCSAAQYTEDRGLEECFKNHVCMCM